MMNHYKKENLTVKEADILRKKATEVTEDMEIKPMISCIDTRKAWSDEKMCMEVVEQRVCVIGYFHKNEMTIAKKLAEFLDLVSSS